MREKRRREAGSTGDLPEPGRRLHVLALGCPKNRVDAEAVVALAAGEGFDLAAEPDDADVILVATCGFVAEAGVESVERIVELARRRRKGARLVVAGCLAQRYGEELARALPEADAVVGTADLTRVVDALSGRTPRVSVGPAGADLRRAEGRLPSLHPGSAYLKVADGCSRTCAFCTIPEIRGPFRSRPIDELCDEARELARAGIVELNLVAQDLSSFGRDRPGGGRLVDLLSALDRVEGIRWIRPLYLYPDRSLREVASAVARLERVVPYLDVPVQHASNRVLRRMKRGAGAASTRSLLLAARRAFPEDGLWLRSTLIVGHPGEGEEDFDALLELVRWARFDHLGVFVWSAEEGTASASLPDRVPRRASAARRRKVMALQRRISRARCRGMRGRTVTVLVEGPSEDSPLVYQGRHAGQAPEVDGVVYLDRPVRPGSLVAVRITKSGDYDLYGVVLEPEAHPGRPGAQGRRA